MKKITKGEKKQEMNVSTAVDIIGAMRQISEENRDAREVMYKKGTDYLYSPEKINYVTGLKHEQVYGLEKMIIPELEYEGKWCDKKTIFTLSYDGFKIKAKPNEITITPIKSNIREIRISFMELLISVDRKGREDLVRMLMNAQQEMGLLDKIGQYMPRRGGTTNVN